MTYTFEHLDIQGGKWTANIGPNLSGTIYQSPGWLAFLSRSQNGELVVGALREGRETIGYCTGLIVRKLGLRILGSPFPGWSTNYMGLTLSAGVERRRAVQALIGEYKRKYGGSEIEVPWFRKSKYPWIRYLLDMAKHSHKLRQQCLGRFNRLLARAGPRGTRETSEIGMREAF